MTEQDGRNKDVDTTTLTADERELLRLWRGCDDTTRLYLLRIAERIAGIDNGKR